MSDWFDVLSYFEQKRYFRNGLTIPFLIGSTTILEPDEQVKSVKEFITDVSESKIPITLMTCGWLDEYVLSIMDDYDQKMMNGYKNLYREFGNLIITDHSFKNCNSLSEIISELDKDLSSAIESGGYSFIDGNYTDFDPTDLERLNEMLSK